MRVLMVAALVAAGCAKKGAAEAIPDLPDKDPGGPVAGPHEVVEGDVEAPSSDTPGWGPLHPYIARVRKAVTEDAAKCLANAGPGTEPALVVARVDPAGVLQQVNLARSSGDPQRDKCLLQGFRGVTLEAPPAEVVEDGVVAFQIAFRADPVSAPPPITAP
ncbi:MAG: hypothetical protein R3F59_17805 [Myxococcota bacterium]